MHRLWLHLSSDVFSAALTGLRHAGATTGQSNLNATLAATTTADTVAVKTTEYQPGTLKVTLLKPFVSAVVVVGGGVQGGEPNKRPVCCDLSQRSTLKLAGPFHITVLFHPGSVSRLK